MQNTKKGYLCTLKQPLIFTVYLRNTDMECFHVFKNKLFSMILAVFVKLMFFYRFLLMQIEKTQIVQVEHIKYSIQVFDFKLLII